MIVKTTILAFLVFLLSSCVSTEYQQLTDQGVQIGEKIYAEGTSAGSTLALNNAETHQTHQRKVGVPETRVPYTPESHAVLVAEVSRQITFHERVAGFFKNLGLDVLGQFGIGWLFPGLAGIFAVWRKKQAQILKMKDVAVAGVNTVRTILDDAKAGKGLNEEKVIEIAKRTQDALGVRSEVESILAEYEASKKEKENGKILKEAKTRKR